MVKTRRIDGTSHCSWDHGIVRMVPNDAHKTSGHRLFLQAAVERDEELLERLICGSEQV